MYKENTERIVQAMDVFNRKGTNLSWLRWTALRFCYYFKMNLDSTTIFKMDSDYVTSYNNKSNLTCNLNMFDLVVPTR